MSVKRVRLRRRTDDNSYDIVHLETEAALVKTDTGASLEDALQNVPEYGPGGAHALTHYEGGSDPVTPESIGAASKKAIDDLTDGIQRTKDRIDTFLSGALEVVTDVPYQVGSLTYSGSTKSPSWGNYDDSKMTISGTTSATSAGTYTATFTLKKGFVWKDGTDVKNVTWRIGRATISATPSQSGSLTYTGSAQTPSWSNYNTSQLSISGTTSGTNAGSYTAKFTPKANYQWSGGSTSAKSVSWSIGKAAGSLSLSTTSAKFTTASASQQVTVTRAGDGAISAASSNTAVATVSVSGNVATIKSGTTNGSCSVTVNVAAGTNHTAPSSKTVSVTRDVFTVSTTLGATVSWAGYSWIVVHVEGTKVYLALDHIYETCTTDATYERSNLAARAKAFENSLPTSALASAINTTVESVTAKIFVATLDQMQGGFEYFSSNERRACKYNGSAHGYWTCTPNTVSLVYAVGGNGALTALADPTATGGFRPFVALKRS